MADVASETRSSCCVRRRFRHCPCPVGGGGGAPDNGSICCSRRRRAALSRRCRGKWGGCRRGGVVCCQSGDDPDAHKQKCQTDRPSAQSGHQESSHPQNCQIDGPSVQSEHHENSATPSSSSVSSDKAAQTIIGTPLKGKDDLNVHIKDIDGSCNDATCGSPTVIGCTEPCLQEGGQDGSVVLCHTLTKQSEDKKDPAASAGASHSSKECSAGSIEPTLSSEEANTAGDDRSSSFEVTTEISEPGSPGNAPRHTSEESKKMSVLETGKEQQLGTKVVHSAGALSVSSHTGDITKTKSAPLDQPQQHSTPASTFQTVQISILPVLSTSVSCSCGASTCHRFTTCAATCSSICLSSSYSRKTTSRSLHGVSFWRIWLKGD